MNKQYNNNKKDFKNRGERPNHRSEGGEHRSEGRGEYRGNRSDRGERPNHRSDRGERKYDNKKFERNNEKPQTTTNLFTKNPNGFLIVSLVIKKETPSNIAMNSIESVLSCEQKKKVVISFEDATDKTFISSIKRKFENAFGVFFFTPKATLAGSYSQNSAKIHTEVLHAFKSNFFLAMDANVALRPFALEKMISFLSKEGDTIAVAPKFYNSSKDFLKTCRRFFTMKDLFHSSNETKLEHLMMERGEVGYYSIHRVDYSPLDCMLFLTDALLKVGTFTSAFANQDLRDSTFCKKLYAKSKGKIIFYPHSRAIVNGNLEETQPSMMEKAKYLLMNAF